MWSQHVAPSPPRVRRALAFGYRTLSSAIRRARDRLEGTFCQRGPQGRLSRHLPRLSLGSLDRECIRDLAGHYLDHRFNLLGSGWVQVRHGMQCAGLEEHRFAPCPPVEADHEGRWLDARINAANLREARRIWSLVGDAYAPIDWHLDFKSGYRWSEATWYLDVPLAQRAGADIKVPWELARMQYLARLAWAYAFALEGHAGFRSPQTYASELRDQVLDFIATNPPRFGVNWRSTMDVGIRIVNWLVAYDLFRAYGAEFDPEFEQVLTRSVYEHGLHVVHNLERGPGLRGNHYLANIAGLAFVSAYLPISPETDAWLAFAVGELINEVGRQFNPDGSNFEGSTSYHRLAAEMVVYATALAQGLPEDRKAAIVQRRPALAAAGQHVGAPGDRPRSGPLRLFPDWYLERVERMAEFVCHITKPGAHVPQFGDNDSGRFLKLQPVYHRMHVRDARVRYENLSRYTALPEDAVHWEEDVLDHRHLVAAVAGLFERDDLAAFAGDVWVEAKLVGALAGGTPFPSARAAGAQTAAAAARVRVGTQDAWMHVSERLALTPDARRRAVRIAIPGGGARRGLELYAYPEFGVYVCRSARLYLAIRCGPIGQDGLGGHAHNDQLTVELNVDGTDWITDPGTYLYTPLPARRNEYRSVRAHFAPRCADGREPGRLDLGLFRLGDEAKAECLYFGWVGFVGTHRGYGCPVYRVVRLLDEEVQVTDFSDGDLALEAPALQKVGDALVFRAVPPSTGYGVRVCRGPLQ